MIKFRVISSNFRDWDFIPTGKNENHTFLVDDFNILIRFGGCVISSISDKFTFLLQMPRCIW